MWENIKKYVIIFLDGVTAGILFLLKLKSVQNVELEVENQILAKQEEDKKKEAEKIKDSIGKPVEDKNEQEVVDYWKGELK